MTLIKSNLVLNPEPRVVIQEGILVNMIQRTVMPKAAMPRQPQGQSGRCSGRAHGDGWVSRARHRRRARQLAAPGSPLRGVTRPGGPDIEGGWPEIQAGLLVRHFHNWQRATPRPRGRGRDRGRPTGPVVGRHPVRVDERMGRGQAMQGGMIDAVACMAETLRHRVGGHGASLDEEDGAGGKNG